MFSAQKSSRGSGSATHMFYSRNLGILSKIHFFNPHLNSPIFVQVLRVSGRAFQFSDPLKLKLFLARLSLVFGTTILPALLSVFKYVAIYSGSPNFLILNTKRSVEKYELINCHPSQLVKKLCSICERWLVSYYLTSLVLEHLEISHITHVAAPKER